MSYQQQQFRSGDVLYAAQLNAMDAQIARQEADVASLSPLLQPRRAVLAPARQTDGQIYMVPANQAYGNNADYAYAFYDVEPGKRYLVSGSTASNGSLYPLGAFWNGTDNWRLSVFGTDGGTVYTDYEVTAPAGAVRMVVNKAQSRGSLRVMREATLPETLDSLDTALDTAEGLSDRVAAVEKRAERYYSPANANGLVLAARKNPFRFAPFDRGYVSFVFDDLRDTVDSPCSIFAEYGMPICLAAIPSRIGVTATGLSQARGAYTPGMMMGNLCLQVLADGGEILMHNANVVSAANQHDYEFMYAYFVGNRKLLDTWGMNVRGLIRAGGADQLGTSDEIKRWVIGNYEYSNMWSDFGYESSAERSDEHNHMLDRHDINQPLSDVKALIRSAAQNRRWIRFFAHDYEYGGGETFTGESDLRSILDYCNQVGVRVVTYAYMFDHFRSSLLEEKLRGASA